MWYLNVLIDFTRSKVLFGILMWSFHVFEHLNTHKNTKETLRLPKINQNPQILHYTTKDHERPHNATYTTQDPPRPLKTHKLNISSQNPTKRLHKTI